MEHIRQNPNKADFVQDPYRFYDAARELGDIVWWDEYGMAIASSHAAVTAVLKDKRMGREVPVEHRQAPPAHLAGFYAIEDHSMLELEPPRHTRLRGNVLRAFTSARVQALAPEISQLADALIDGFPDDRPFDLLPVFCQRLPVIVIARLLGMPQEMADDMLAWSNRMVAMYQAHRTRAVEDAANRAAAEFAAFMADHIQTRRNDLSGDLISDLIRAETDGERLSRDELITTCILLMNAGHEATAHALGNGVAAILGADVDRKALAPSFVSNTVEEILRYDPPLHLFVRHVYEDLTLFGHRFRRGDRIGCLLAAANRDPLLVPDPHSFDPTRPPVAHMAFGAGIHFCLGAPLARLEMQIALPLLFSRCPDLALAEPPEYASTYHFHGLTRLMVTGAGGR